MVSNSLTPETEGELCEILATRQAPLNIVGGGSRGVPMNSSGDFLSSRGLCGVTDYEPGALTMVVKAGTPIAEINHVLEAENQALPFDPPMFSTVFGCEGRSTIGGVMASNASGPRRFHSGGARDFCLGVRFVDGRARVLKNGGRVMKNVTGYDLVKLLCGSFGTVGMMTEVSLKVLARPETEVTLVREDLDVAAAITLFSRALGSSFEVSGAAIIGGRQCVRLEGHEKSVAYRKRRLLDGICQGFQVVDGAESARIWRDIRDVSDFHRQECDLWRVVLKPSDAPDFICGVGHLDPDARYLVDWAGGLVWVEMSAQGNGTDLRTLLSSGSARLLRGPSRRADIFPMFHPEAAIIHQLSAKLRREFDPNSILNPGLMER